MRSRRFFASIVIVIAFALASACEPDPADTGPFDGRACTSQDQCPPYLACSAGKCRERCDTSRQGCRCVDGGCVP
jgi:hypothetical protein